MAKAACARRGSACWRSLRASTGTRSSSAWCEQHGGLRIYGSGIASSYTESVFALDDSVAQPHPLRARARDAHPLPHRRLPGNATSCSAASTICWSSRDIDFAPLYERVARAARVRARRRARRPTPCITRGTGRYPSGRRNGHAVTPPSHGSGHRRDAATSAAPSPPPSLRARRQLWCCSTASVDTPRSRLRPEDATTACTCRPISSMPPHVEAAAQGRARTLRPHRRPVQHRRRLPHGHAGARNVRRRLELPARHQCAHAAARGARGRAAHARPAAAARSSTSAPSPRKRARPTWARTSRRRARSFA